MTCPARWTRWWRRAGMIGQSGSVLVADELVANEFTAASDLERYHYG